MARYSGSGWHRQSIRHSRARKYGRAEPYKKTFEGVIEGFSTASNQTIFERTNPDGTRQTIVLYQEPTTKPRVHFREKKKGWFTEFQDIYGKEFDNITEAKRYFSKVIKEKKDFGSPETINLGRYAGTWEQKKVVNEPIFQRGCQRVTATYTPISKGRIKVTNRCYKKGKLSSKIVGTARSVSKNNRKLKVSFFPPFEGDYNIKKINPSYTKATVKSGKTRWELKKIR